MENHVSFSNTLTKKSYYWKFLMLIMNPFLFCETMGGNCEYWIQELRQVNVKIRVKLS